MEQVLRESSFLVKDHYEGIQSSEAETLRSQIPNGFLMISWALLESGGRDSKGNLEGEPVQLHSLNWKRCCSWWAIGKCEREYILWFLA